MTVRVRFAPAPTGYLHMGNIRAVFMNYAFAKKRSVEAIFILRFDDTDQERSRKEFVTSIEEDLRWLGMNWQESYHQSKRVAQYDEVVAQLKKAGRLYPCYETADELEYKRNRALKRGQPPIYDREALSLSTEKKHSYEKEGRRPHWRFQLKDGPIVWQDMIRGETMYQAEHLGDPVLIREDGSYLYHLPSVVDDVQMNITHILRGEDHVTNTAWHVQLFDAMGAQLPQIGHFARITGEGGEKLGKRLGTQSIGEMREKHGIEPMALNSFMARLGTSLASEPFYTWDELIKDFDLGRFGRAQPQFHFADLVRFSARFLHHMPYGAAQSYLQDKAKTIVPDSRLSEVDETWWNIVRGNLDEFNNIEHWLLVCFGHVVNGQPNFSMADQAYLDKAAALLPQKFTHDSFKEWIAAVQKETGRKGMELFQPIRLALTCKDKGPELKDLLPYIGPEKCKLRLQRSTVEHS